MVTVFDVIRFRAHRQGQAIHQLKLDCQAVPIKVYQSLNCSVPVMLLDPKLAFGAQWFKLVREVEVKHICPAHPRWAEYQTMKRLASMWLTAIQYNKWCGKRRCNFNDATIGEFMGSRECQRHSHDDQLSWEAYEVFETLNRRLDKGKINLDEIEAWKKECEEAKNEALARRAQISEGMDNLIKTLPLKSGKRGKQDKEVAIGK